jgi:hypothetical protein
VANHQKLFVRRLTTAKMLDVSIYTIHDLVRSGAQLSVRINPTGKQWS